MWDLPLNRALTLGQLIMLNRLKANEHLRRAIALAGGGMTRHQPPSVPLTAGIREIRMAVRVGFAGLQAYVDGADAALDNRADQLADRVDKIKGRGIGVMDAHDKRLDGVENQIDKMDAKVRAGSNGNPETPLAGS